MTSQEITRQNQNLKDLIFTLKEKEHWERSRRLTEQSILAFSDQSWMKEITQVRTWDLTCQYHDSGNLVRASCRCTGTRDGGLPFSAQHR